MEKKANDVRVLLTRNTVNNELVNGLKRETAVHLMIIVIGIINECFFDESEQQYLSLSGLAAVVELNKLVEKMGNVGYTLYLHNYMLFNCAFTDVIVNIILIISPQSLQTYHNMLLTAYMLIIILYFIIYFPCQPIYLNVDQLSYIFIP